MFGFLTYLSYLNGFGDWSDKNNAYEVDRADDLFQLASYLVDCCNTYFRIHRGEGLWLFENASSTARLAGIQMNVTR